MGPALKRRTVVRRLAATCLAAALVGLSACGRTPGDALEEATRAIQAAHIDQYGRMLSAEAMAGRHHASPEADSSVAFLLHELERLGIGRSRTAARLLDKRPSAFVHEFSVGLQRLGSGTQFALLQGTETRIARAGEDFLPLLYSRTEQVTGKVVRLGTPAELLHPAARDTLRGRVVLVEPRLLLARPGEAPDAKFYRAAARLTELEAAGVAFTEVAEWLRLASASYPTQLPLQFAEAANSAAGLIGNLTPARLCIGLQAQAWRTVVERTCPAVVVRPGWTLSARTPSEAGLQVDLVAEVSLGANVLVGFGGRESADEMVIVAAHYDHAGVNSAGEVLHGADDNASGVAALLEVARALHATHAALRRSVLLVFTAAELQGGQGMEALLHDLPLLLGAATPVAALSFDGLGRNGRDFLQVVGAADEPDLLRVLLRHNHRAALHAPALLLDAEAELAQADSDLPWEHAVTQALLARAGIPSLLLRDGNGVLRSAADDAWPGVEVDKVARAARLVLRTVWDLAQERQADAVWARTRP